MKNYYDILGIETNASFDEIKAAYKALLKKFHPDVNPQQREFFEKKSKSINEAYEILSNPSKKSSYDMRLKEFLNRQHNNQTNSNYNQQKEEDLKRREEELKNKQNENDRRQREKEEELKRKQNEFDRKQREAELIKNENEKRQREKETNRKPIFIAIGILLFLVAGFGIYALLPKEDDAWQKAKLTNTKEAYQNFLSEYPKTYHRDEINTILNELETLYWQNVELEDTKDIYQKYLYEYPNGNYAKQADSIVIALELIEKYTDVQKFNEGLARVGQANDSGFGGKFGFVDKKGIVVVPLKYSDAYPFYEGLASVKEEKYGFIDKTGAVVIDLQYENVVGTTFKEGLVSVEKDGQSGFIDRMGSTVIPLQHDYKYYYFLDGLAMVRKDGKYGFIDKTGTIVIPIKYEEGTTRFYQSTHYSIGSMFNKILVDNINSLIKVRKNGKWFYINRKGKCLKGDCP